MSLQEWRGIKARVFEREGGRCQWCGRRGTDFHHVVKRSAGGADHVDNIVLLCRRDHERTDLSGKGRLVIVPLGDERFRFTYFW